MVLDYHAVFDAVCPVGLSFRFHSRMDSFRDTKLYFGWAYTNSYKLSDFKISKGQKEIFDSQLPHSVAFRNVWLTCFIHILLSGSVKPDFRHLNMECILKEGVLYHHLFWIWLLIVFFVFFLFLLNTLHYDLYSQKWFVNLFTNMNTYTEMYIV